MYGFMMLGCRHWQTPGSANIPRTDDDPEEFEGDHCSTASLEDGKEDPIDLDKVSPDGGLPVQNSSHERK